MGTICAEKEMRRKTKITIAIIAVSAAIFFLYINEVFFSKSCTVYVYVYDQLGDQVEGASVTLIRGASGYTGLTNSEGLAYFGYEYELTMGGYEVKINAVSYGYLTVDEKVGVFSYNI